MGRKSKEELEKEFSKTRIKYMRYARELERCHPNSKRYEDIRNKCIIEEENCTFLLRKIYRIKKGEPDRLIP